jgi:hypothetical protein
LFAKMIVEVGPVPGAHPAPVDVAAAAVLNDDFVAGNAPANESQADEIA